MITSWSFRADATAPAFLKLKVARDTGGGNWTIVGESGTQSPPADALSTYPTRVPVKAGDVIGYYISDGVLCSFGTGDHSDTADTYGIRGGDPAPGTTPTYTQTHTVRIDISAQLERDADGDGYGDETQDQCFTDPTTQGPCPVPTISGTAQVGRTLTATPGGAPVNPSYQWLDCDSSGANCTGISGATSISYALAISDAGHTILFRKTATDASGTQTNHSAQSAVVAPVTQPPTNVIRPTVSGTRAAGKRLACSIGTWTNGPTGFAYVWSRDGTPVVGATSSRYTVQTLDEGSTLTCSVTARNAVGSASATSLGLRVRVPRVAGCPAAAGRLSGANLGPVRLGLTRQQARRKFKHSSDRGKRYQDFFCFTPIGIRVGLASPKLLSTLPTGLRGRFVGRVVWISTANPRYAIRGVRPGATLKAARRRLHVAHRIRIGANDWYLGPAGSVSAVLKVRHGEVQEVGVAVRSLTLTRRAQATFMGSFG